MFNFFGLFKKKEVLKKKEVILPIKDRNDRRKCDSSTNWEQESYCPYCFEVTEHKEKMADICNSCGSYDERLSGKKRVYREIWNGKSWAVQRSYKNKLFMAGEEVSYEKEISCERMLLGTVKTDREWVYKTFEGLVFKEKETFPVLDNGELFIYKKDLIE